MDVQADLSLYLTHMTEDMFSNIAAQILAVVMLNKINMPHPLIIFSQSDYLIQVAQTNSNT